MLPIRRVAVGACQSAHRGGKMDEGYNCQGGVHFDARPASQRIHVLTHERVEATGIEQLVSHNCAMNTVNHKRRTFNKAALGLSAASTALAASPALLPILASAQTSAGTKSNFKDAFDGLQRKHSARWIEQGKKYTEAINRYHAAMDKREAEIEAGKKPAEIPEPKTDPRKAIANELLRFAKTHLATATATASATASEIAQWRAAFPFGFDALIKAYADDSCSVEQCFALDGNDCAVVVKNFNGKKFSVGVKRGIEWKFDATVHCVGRSHHKKTWAFATRAGVETRDGFDGKKLQTFAYPRGNEGLPAWLKLGPTKEAQRADVLVPFSDGQRVLLANETGVYLLDATASKPGDKVRRLHPQAFDKDGPYTWPKNKDENDKGLSLSMVHVALSPDEKYIALGEQDSSHVLLNVQGKVIATVDVGNYPHYALFDRASKHVLFNECHLYSGITSAVALSQIPATLSDKPVELKKVAVDEVLRVYSATAGQNAFYLGGSGYMNAVTLDGTRRWRHHVGGSVKAIDTINDEKQLLVSSYSGLLVRYDVRPGNPENSDPMRIGDSPLWDAERWLFLDDVSSPIPW